MQRAAIFTGSKLLFRLCRLLYGQIRDQSDEAMQLTVEIADPLQTGVG